MVKTIRNYWQFYEKKAQINIKMNNHEKLLLLPIINKTFLNFLLTK